ncbi:hypothetical protein, partial [Aeromonas caviae]|uniref:hypothetical protein n=1 Tax=Aeromonas caviae TaxID=648 RepID=UPI002B49CB61
LATNQIAQTGLSSLPPVIYYSEQLFRKWLKTMDQMVLNNNRDPSKLANLAGQASDLMRQLGQVTDQVLLSQFKISSPEGGFHDVNVQRLLARSSCLRYDRYVRSVYGISIQD